MRQLRAWLLRLAGSFKKNSGEQELADEFESNLELHVEDNIRSGMTPAAARRVARIKFGSVDAAKEAWRDRRSVPLLETLWRDVKYSFRMLRKGGVFTIVAALSLALGIGANTTVFSIANAFYKGLPFKDADSIVYIREIDRTQGGGQGPSLVSHPDFVDFKNQNRTFVDLAAFGTGTYNISDDVTTPERVVGSRITPNLFSVIGQPPLLGRDFAAGEDQSGAEPVVIIGYGIWQTRYGGAADIVGRTLRSNGEVHRIVGVMPQGMKFPIISEIWLPMLTGASFSDRGARGGDIFGRLREGVSIEQAQADISAIAGRLEKEFPDTNRNIDAVLLPYVEQFTSQQHRIAMTALHSAVNFVLLIVCVNLANLLLARAVSRTRESAIRLAIGSTRWQIVRQLMVESVMLSCGGGLLGLALAAFGVKALGAAAQGARLPYWIDFSMDYPVLIYAAAISIATGILFGLVPALQVSRTEVNEKLKDGSAAGMNVRSRRMTSILVTAEIALTMVVLVGAGLMIRSLLKFNNLDIGVRTDDMLIATLVLTGPKYANASDLIAFEELLMDRFRATPGMERVTLASHAPAGGAHYQRVETDDVQISEVATHTVVPGYFNAVGSGILRGRDFSQRDGAPGNPSAIVNARFALSL